MSIPFQRVPTIAERCGRRAYEASAEQVVPWTTLGREARERWIDSATAAIVEFACDEAAEAAHARLREGMSLTPDSGDDIA